MAAISQKDKSRLARQRLHTTVFGQSFSPCGKFLATCDNFGNISVFNLPTALSADATEESWKPCFTFKAQEGALYTLTSTDRLLIAAGTEDIKAYVWSDILAKDSKPIWSLSIETVERFGRPETNSIVIGELGNGSAPRLYAGCGDKNIHVWDLEAGRHLHTFSGHDDYIHSVVLRSSREQCVSGSEDGTVRIWDTRCPGEAVHVLEPYKLEEGGCKYGRWIGSVAVDKADDWMICGGGPRMRMYHLRSLESTTVFDTNFPINHVMFHEDSIVCGGGDGTVKHWAVNGDLRFNVACTPSTVYNVAINNKSDNTKVMSIAGNSHKIDICTNFGYKAFSMSVC